MTDKEKAIVMAHTGKCMLTGDKFQIFHKYVENIMGRPIYTHDIGWLEDDIKEKSKDDFIALCEDESNSENPNRWIPVSERLPEENGWYQCTVILNDLPLVMELFYKNDKWLDNRRINMFDTYDIYGYGNTKEKHKLSYQELISEFEWTENVISWKTLPEPYKTESEDK